METVGAVVGFVTNLHGAVPERVYAQPRYRVQLDFDEPVRTKCSNSLAMGADVC